MQLRTPTDSGKAHGRRRDRCACICGSVETHRETIKRKLDIPNSAELGREAVRWEVENGV
jgi:hypothetical protein